MSHLSTLFCFSCTWHLNAKDLQVHLPPHFVTRFSHQHHQLVNEQLCDISLIWGPILILFSESESPMPKYTEHQTGGRPSRRHEKHQNCCQSLGCTPFNSPNRLKDVRLKFKAQLHCQCIAIVSGKDQPIDKNCVTGFLQRNSEIKTVKIKPIKCTDQKEPWLKKN